MVTEKMLYQDEAGVCCLMSKPVKDEFFMNAGGAKLGPRSTLRKLRTKTEGSRFTDIPSFFFRHTEGYEVKRDRWNRLPVSGGISPKADKTEDEWVKFCDRTRYLFKEPIFNYISLGGYSFFTQFLLHCR